MHQFILCTYKAIDIQQKMAGRRRSRSPGVRAERHQEAETSKGKTATVKKGEACLSNRDNGTLLHSPTLHVQKNEQEYVGTLSFDKDGENYGRQVT